MKLEITKNVSLEDSLVFESVYDEHLAMSLEDKQWLKDTGVEFLYLINAETKELIAETYFAPLDLMKDWETDLDDDGKPLQENDGLDDYYGKEVMYCYSNTTLPKFQGQGYGKFLKGYFLAKAKQEGYKLVMGHSINKESLGLNMKFGAVQLAAFPDWYKTGLTAFLYKIVL